MSTPDFGKLILIVNNYIKTSTSLSPMESGIAGGNEVAGVGGGVIIVWRCQYNEEDTTITSPAIPIEEGKKSDFYMRKAFKACKKQMKQWVRSVHDKPSVIGTQYVFAVNEIIDDDLIE